MEGTKKKKVKQDRVFLVDELTGQRWEHAKSPFSRKLDGDQYAETGSAISELRTRYGNKGYTVTVEQEEVPS